ncbi:NADH-quinone oxidoreductase subunit B family protein [Gluconobacter oxydans]|uniref:NADH-quinone oxidoreductase subunit B family protein n=1 Tax=Gluconobacter oxydans TaxID=442 RepID=UPI0039EB99B4
MKTVQRTGPLSLLYAFMDAARGRASVEGEVPRRERPIGLYVLETGGCEGCFMEIESLKGSAFALEQAGFVCVSDPADADWLLLTGAVTRVCAEMLDRVWRAMPPGRSLIAVGACAVDGGPFPAGYATLGGLEALTPVRRSIAGCPPSPDDILRALQELAQV